MKVDLDTALEVIPLSETKNEPFRAPSAIEFTLEETNTLGDIDEPNARDCVRVQLSLKQNNYLSKEIAERIGETPLQAAKLKVALLELLKSVGRPGFNAHFEKYEAAHDALVDELVAIDDRTVDQLRHQSQHLAPAWRRYAYDEGAK